MSEHVLLHQVLLQGETHRALGTLLEPWLRRMAAHSIRVKGPCVSSLRGSSSPAGNDAMSVEPDALLQIVKAHGLEAMTQLHAVNELLATAAAAATHFSR